MSEFNDWFCSLPEGRQAVLRDDKWRLADNAFQAGCAQVQAKIDQLNKACDQRAAHEYKLMGEIDALKAQNSQLQAALQTVIDNADYVDTGHQIAIDALTKLKEVSA